MASGGFTGKQLEGMGSDFVYEFVCTRCDLRDKRYTEASHYCSQCREFYCRLCRRLVACEHDLLGRGDVGIAGKRQHMGQCPSHLGNKVESFCGDHNEICCKVCICLKHRNCAKLEHTSRVAKRRAQEQELDMLQTEFTSLQKRLYQLRAKVKLCPHADQKLLKGIKDYRAAIQKLLDEFEQDTLDEIQEMREKCVEKIQTTPVELENVGDLNQYVVEFQRNLIKLRVDEARRFERVKQFTSFKLDPDDKTNDDD